MQQLMLLGLARGVVLATEVAPQTPRTDFITAARVDATLILLPLIGWLEASRMLAANHVPAHVAARVLALPMARRGIEVTPLEASPE